MGMVSEGSTWCGNAAWFPGYPLLLAGLHVFGLPILGTGIAVSWIFSAAALGNEMEYTAPHNPRAPTAPVNGIPSG